MPIQTEPILSAIETPPPALPIYEDEQEPEEDGEEHNRILLDPSKWTYRDYVSAMRSIILGEWEKAFPLIMQAAIGWTYPIPFAPDAYRQLSFADLPEIGEAVQAVVSEYVAGLDLSQAKLNLRRWSMDDFFKYKAAVRAGDTATREVLFHKVSRMKGLPPVGTPLTFEQGATLSQAIDEAAKGMFATGKSRKQPTST